MKIIPYPETRQVFNYDCGANALVSVLVFAGLEEREDRVALLARTSHNGTSTAGVLRILQYYGLLCGPPHNSPKMRRSQLCGVQHEFSAISGGRCCTGHHIICVLQGS